MHIKIPLFYVILFLSQLLNPFPFISENVENPLRISMTFYFV